jgi:crossover junction endodeoxyribonuclease RuvC
VQELIVRHRPDALAVESIFYAKNVRTTITLGHARGVILLAGELAGLTVHEFPPPRSRRRSSARARPARSRCSSC